MIPSGIEHIGILTTDLEQAIERWSAATGFTFSPIVRYRTDRYQDAHDPRPHHHDARIAFSLQGRPRIELMEVTGSGTHGPDQVGVHHLGFNDVADPTARMRELAAQGIGTDGVSRDEADRVLLCFTDKDALDGVRLELISPLPGPIVADDGSTLPTDPRTGRPDVWSG